MARKAYEEGCLAEEFAAPAGNIGTGRYDRLEQKAIDFVHAARKRYGELVNRTRQFWCPIKQSRTHSTGDLSKPTMEAASGSDNGFSQDEEELRETAQRADFSEKEVNVESLLRSIKQITSLEFSLLASQGSRTAATEDETVDDHANETVGSRHVRLCGRKLLLGELGATLGFVFVVLLVIVGLALTPVLSVDVSRLLQVVLEEAASYNEASKDIGKNFGLSVGLNLMLRSFFL